MTEQVVNASNEWDPLQEVIVGVADHSCFPFEPRIVVENTVPARYWDEHRPHNPFPEEIVAKACEQLDNFAKVLTDLGITVRRPKVVDFSSLETPGYTASMVRDAITVAQDRIIEAPYSWRSRNHESLAYEDLFKHYEAQGAKVYRRPPPPADVDALLGPGERHREYVINDNRPAFDAADFIRLDKTIIGQLSNTTNRSGVKHLEKCLEGTGIEVVLVESLDSHAFHIDATITPLREGLLIYNPTYITVEELQKVERLKGWKFIPAPFPKPREYPPFFMSSAWLIMNILVIDPKRAIIEAEDDHLADLLLEHGITPIRVPFQYVHSLGGSFHCTTVDIRRDHSTSA
ncbi:hypothetical protein BOTBODRAFT_26771 [Botryobasidium botryosum FD-172 SS1]|uniref:Glycine amidinotransferase, mitochondrial n=1 Tax=Botryobasidium botryosum (strain FD-172 SS1) TaxID=930990 RepID=A0A067MYC6_BOTB1|nr:hypothetical protein BOTBODRAFT_26771 [Botryobasidium botryosum FD-172 SS1]